MSQWGSWETKLEQLGAFLAAQDAHHVMITERGSCLAVAWQTAGASPHERSFIEADFADLWPATQSDWLGSSSRAALLGSLGREIDRAQLDVACIVEEADGFVISGSSGGLYANAYYLYSALRDGRAQPGDPGKAAPSKSPWTGSRVPVPKAPNARPMFVPPHNSPLRHRLHLIS